MNLFSARITLLTFSILGAATALTGCGGPNPAPTTAYGRTTYASTSAYNYISCQNCGFNPDGSCPQTCNTPQGCSTGYQSYGSLAEECAGLQSDSRNNSCDLARRQQFFTDFGCAGTFTRSS
jgi:hypothetical protein